MGWENDESCFSEQLAESVFPVILGMSGNIIVAALMYAGISSGGGVGPTEVLDSFFMLFKGEYSSGNFEMGDYILRFRRLDLLINPSKIMLRCKSYLILT